MSLLIYLRLSIRKMKKLNKLEKLCNSLFPIVVTRSQLYVLLEFPALPRYISWYYLILPSLPLLSRFRFTDITINTNILPLYKKIKFSIKDFFIFLCSVLVIDITNLITEITLITAISYIADITLINTLSASVTLIRNQSIDLHSKSTDWLLHEDNTGT